MIEPLTNLVLETLESMKKYGYDVDNPNPFKVLNNYLDFSKIDFGFKFKKDMPPGKGYILKEVPEKDTDRKPYEIHLPPKHTFLQELILAHEFAHVLLWENPIIDAKRKEIEESVRKNHKYENFKSLENFCELFARFFMFPPENISSESKKDLLYLSKEKNLLKGIMKLGDKRRMTTSQLMTILNHSKIFKKNFPEYIFITINDMNYTQDIPKIWKNINSFVLELRYIKIDELILPKNFELDNGLLFDDTGYQYSINLLYNHNEKSYIYVNENTNNSQQKLKHLNPKYRTFEISDLVFFREPLYRYTNGMYPQIENLFGEITHGYDKPRNLIFSKECNEVNYKRAINLNNYNKILMARIDLKSGAPLKKELEIVHHHYSIGFSYGYYATIRNAE